MEERERWWNAALALVLVQVIFGTLSVVGKVALAHLTPLALAALRVSLAACILILLHRRLVGERVSRRELLPLAGLAVLGIVINQVFFLNGLALTTAVDATVLVSTIPAFTVVIALAARREGISAPKLAGMALAFSGVVVLVGGAALGSEAFLGNVLVTLNALSYSAYLVFSRPYVARHDPLTVVAYTFVFGALMIVPIGTPDLLRTDFASLPPETWLALAYIVVFPSVLTYYLNNWALRRVASSTVASFVYLQPLVAAALAVPFLGEELGPRTLLAAAMIVAGVWLASRRADLPRVPGVR